jgi:hypothetical protein
MFSNGRVVGAGLNLVARTIAHRAKEYLIT